MEKMIVTEYGRPIMMQKVKEFTQMQYSHCLTAANW